MEKKSVKYNNGLGEVVYTKNPLSKSIKVSLSSMAQIKVSLPPYVSWSSAEEFLFSVAKEIVAKREQILAKAPALGEASKKDLLYGFSSQSIIAPFLKPKNISAISYNQMSFYAHDILPKRVKIMYDIMSKKLTVRRKTGEVISDPFRYNRVAIKSNSTNWGSCSRLRNINLNMNLVRLPIVLMDYVIAHELCHLVYMNHGKNFHSMLDNITGGRERELSKMLNKYKL